MNTNPKDIGDRTEAKVLFELITRGYSVSVPFGDNDEYDLIVDDDTHLFRVQCKSAWVTKKGTVRFNPHSQTTREGKYHERTYDGEIDAFIVHQPPDDGLFWIAIEDAPRQQMELRYSSEIDHPSIHWAEDFELGETIPPNRSRS